MVVHVEHQGQAVGLEGAGKEVQVGQEGFAGVEASSGVVAGGVVEEVQQALLGGGAGEEGVRGGVVLPEGTEVAGLPAFDGFGRGLVAGVGASLWARAQRRTLARSVLKLRRRWSSLAAAL
jgi:hypothetical protein